MSTRPMAVALSAIALVQGTLAVPYAQAPSATTAPANFWSSTYGATSANTASAGPSVAATPSAAPPGAKPAGAVPSASTSISFPASLPSVASSSAVAASVTSAKSPTGPVAPSLPMRTITADDILAIKPETKGPCDPKQEHPTECITADHAAPLIQQSFNKYGITHPSVQAAVLSTIIFESVGLKYNTNLKNPDKQGTRNMMMKDFVNEFGAQYKLDFDAIIKNETLSFETAAWYLTTKCDFSVRQGLWMAKPEGFSNYVLNCLGGGDLAPRSTIWEAAVNRLGNQ